MELRNPDPSCNPYLALALCLAAGLDGIEKQMQVPGEITEDIFAMDQKTREKNGIASLPGSLIEAVENMEKDPLTLDVLGDHAYTQYIAGKRAEWDAFRISVSQWEIDRYMVNY